MAENPNAPAPVAKRWSKPLGVIPRHLQAMAIGGLSLAMVIVIAFSNRNSATRPKEPSASISSVADPNESRIQEYRRRIEEQAQKLALEQARLAQTGQALEAPGAPEGATLPLPDRPDVPRPTYAAGLGPERNWIEEDRQRRNYESRYASNIALSYRNRSVTAPDSAPAKTGAAAPESETPPNGDAPLQQATGKSYRLFEGTVIDTVLTNRLDGAFSGPVNCLVATNVYTHDHTTLLIPQGTRVLGQVSRVETFGQQRLAVSFHRLIMPDGYSVALDKQPGLSGVGETGLVDQVNHHYGQIFGVSLAIGAIAGLSQANTSHGANASGTDVYRQGVASSLSQTSLNILDRYLNILPTFTIRAGHRVKVYLTADLLLPAYENHRLPSDL